MDGHTRALVVATLALVVLLQTIPEGKGDCCQGVLHGLPPEPRCHDGTKGTPCCGYGPCNIFCCNCDGGCRKGRYYASASRIRGADLIAELDTDGDGTLSLSETMVLVASRNYSSERVQSEFTAMDLNGDEVLSAEEIDPASTC